MARSRQPKPPSKRVKLELFSIHGHVGNEPVDYVALFRDIAATDPKARFEVVGDRVVGIPFLREHEGKLFFSAYTGAAESTFLVLDLNAATEEERGLESGKVIVRKTLGVVDPAKREAVVQFVFHGIGAGQVARVFENIARLAKPSLYEDLSLEFVPIAGRSFLEELEAFSRIQSASVRLARPNYDWQEYGETLETLGQESGARTLEISAVATRNGTLSKRDGLIGLLRDLIGRGRGIIKAAFVKGATANEAGLVTLSLDRHIESRNVEVPATATGQPTEAIVQDLAVQFLDGRPTRVE